jgi:predicted transcriptional regulator
MSINPEHVDNILAGTKKFEFRKNKCKEEIDSIIIYSTSPIMRVVAEVEVKGIIEDTPQVVWSKTESAAGIDKIFFDRYYNGRDVAVAYVLGKVKKFAAPKSLSDYGIKAAPQSYVYVR